VGLAWAQKVSLPMTEAEIKEKAKNQLMQVVFDESFANRVRINTACRLIENDALRILTVEERERLMSFIGEKLTVPTTEQEIDFTFWVIQNAK
jgi:hypothetical protein